jgi:hypothetical protein
VQPRWKIIGVAGIAGVAATGVVIARQRRAHQDYDPDELRERLHRRLAEASATAGGPPEQTADPAAKARRSHVPSVRVALTRARRRPDPRAR